MAQRSLLSALSLHLHEKLHDVHLKQLELDVIKEFHF
jgi:hypothetical protein